MIPSPRFIRSDGFGATPQPWFLLPLRAGCILLSVYVVLGVGGCGRESGDQFGDEIDHSRLSPIRLNATVFSEAPAMGIPLRLKMSGDYLWVSDGAGDPGLHVLDATTGKLLHSVGRKGEGPGEFGNTPSSLEVFQDDVGAVWTWDMRLQRLTRFEPRPPVEYDLELITLEEPRVRRVTWPQRDQLIGVARSQEARFAVYNGDGQFRHSRSGPILGTDDLPLEARLSATDGPSKPCTWPGRGFVILNFFVGRLEYYDLDARFLRLADVPFPSDVMFEQLDDGRIRHLTPRAWYYDCAAHGDRLFALFSGRLQSAFGNDAGNSGRFLHVFDWEGKLLGVVELDRPIRGIAIDEDGDALFASSLMDASIYRYDTSELPW